MNVAGRERKLVVAGLVVDRDRVLITRRLAGQFMAGYWEFPGGKLEPGESPEAALVRELVEEIGIEVKVGRIWEVLHHRYPEFDLVMMVYPCRARGGAVPRAIEVAELAWVAPDGLARYDLLPADGPLVTRLVAEGLPATSSWSGAVS